MSMNLVTLLVPGRQRLLHPGAQGLSHPTTAIRGNLFGMVGMTIAVLTTAALIVKARQGAATGMAGCWRPGGRRRLGAIMAKRVEMTKMPELVAFMHSMIGLAAVFIAMAAVCRALALGIVAKGRGSPKSNRLELALGAHRRHHLQRGR